MTVDTDVVLGNCPECGHSANVKPKYLALPVTCPKCRKQVVLQTATRQKSAVAAIKPALVEEAGRGSVFAECEKDTRDMCRSAKALFCIITVIGFLQILASTIALFFGLLSLAGDSGDVAFAAAILPGACVVFLTACLQLYFASWFRSCTNVIAKVALAILSHS